MMSFTRWDPLDELGRFADRAGYLLGSFDPTGSRESESGRTWRPSVDVYENDSEMVFEAELPGIDPKTVDLKMEKSVLTLRGERALGGGTTEGYHRLERPYGPFSRSFWLPDTTEEAEARATYKDGVLRIVLPKREKARAKQIPVGA